MARRTFYQGGSGGGVLRQTAAPSVDMGSNPYGGFDPGTISAQPFLDYMTQVKTMALDPQQELRDREEAELMEMTRAGLEARGLNYSGVGAGIEGDVMSDFALDWQDRMLGRAATGAGVMSSLGGLSQDIASRGFQQAGQLGSSMFRYNPQTAGGGTGFSRTHNRIGSKPGANRAYVPGQNRYR